MQVNMLEAKTQLSKLVDAVLRGEEVVIANRGKAVVRLVKVEAPVKRIAGAWAGLMSEAEIDHAFSPEVEAEMARLWQVHLDKPIEPTTRRSNARRKPAAKKAAKKVAERTAGPANKPAR